MPSLPKSTKRRKVVKRLKELGWTGPKKEGNGPHPWQMRKGKQVLHLPNPHRQDIGIGLLTRLLQQAGIEHKEWTGDD